MKKCPYCKIEVGGNPVKCPLCQSRLTGDGEEPYFPEHNALQFRSLVYKIQMFIAWTVIIAGLGLDLLLGIRFPGFPDLHWSLLLALWLVAIEFVIVKQFRPGTGSARKVTMMVFVTLILLLITSHYFGIMWLTRDWIVPCVIAGTVIANFVLTMLDKQGNAMAYLLTALVFGVIPFWYMYLKYRPLPMTWTICLMISIILIAGAIIFKGRSLRREFQRRFHM